MVFCNIEINGDNIISENSHNPYFNRWFSAIKVQSSKNQKVCSHNPYFNRWFSAIYESLP